MKLIPPYEAVARIRGAAGTLASSARPRELLCLTAGTGVGKSTIVSELAYHSANVHHQNVGYVALEEGLGRTGQRLMSIEANTPLHIPNSLTDKERREAFDKTLGTGRYFLYDHFGSIDSENLLRKFQYMVTALGVEVLILDHLSILVSGMDQEALSNYGDERKAIDYTMTQLRSFTERTNVSMILVSHLRRPQGDKGHEGGEKVYLSHLRSSASIAQLSDAVVSISRDMSSGENRLELTALKTDTRGSQDQCVRSNITQRQAVSQKSPTSSARTLSHSQNANRRKTRRKLKRMLVEMKGGRCERCNGYYLADVFDFHHKDLVKNCSV